jgi:hypothetical protein
MKVALGPLCPAAASDRKLPTEFPEALLSRYTTHKILHVTTPSYFYYENSCIFRGKFEEGPEDRSTTAEKLTNFEASSSSFLIDN